MKESKKILQIDVEKVIRSKSEKLARKVPRFVINYLKRIIHQDEYRRLHRSHKERLTLPAKERYEEFQKQFPEVCKRVNLGYIASYLGVTQSTLSRLRGDNNRR